MITIYCTSNNSECYMCYIWIQLIMVSGPWELLQQYKFLVTDMAISGSASDVGSINIEVDSVESSPHTSRVSVTWVLTLKALIFLWMREWDSKLSVTFLWWPCMSIGHATLISQETDALMTRSWYWFYVRFPCFHVYKLNWV